MLTVEAAVPDAGDCQMLVVLGHSGVSLNPLSVISHSVSHRTLRSCRRVLHHQLMLVVAQPDALCVGGNSGITWALSTRCNILLLVLWIRLSSQLDHSATTVPPPQRCIAACIRVRAAYMHRNPAAAAACRCWAQHLANSHGASTAFTILQLLLCSALAEHCTE
jgi:hypothetical protein